MLLEINNLSAGYGELHVLNEVSLDVATGEMVVLVGPNGAGKSTVLKSVFGLTNKTGGSIIFSGQDITNSLTHSLIEIGIGLVPQGRMVFPSLRVEENLRMGGCLLNHAETIEQNKVYVYGLFPALKEKKDEFAGNLSGGQQQQLAVARALMMKPEFLMLDEPSLGLSPKLMHEVFEILEKIRQEGTTILVVEQNVKLALQYVDRGYLLAAGKIKFEGNAEQLASEDLMRDAYLT